MDVAVLGTGAVGRALAAATAAAGNNVVMGTRDVDALLTRDGDAFGTWSRSHPQVSVATFGDAARRGEIAFNATAGTASLAVVQSVGHDALAGKVLVDVANPLDFSQGFPPSLTVANTDSLAEQLQRTLPETLVVKALNTVSAPVMVDPTAVGGGEHHLPICGNDETAKATVSEALRGWFGWRNIVDLGDLTAARGMEAYLLLWVRLLGAVDTTAFNVAIVR